MALPEREDTKHFAVLPDNWQSVQLFMRCQTQWRTGMAGLIGLDYGAVQWLLRLYEVEEPRAVLEDLQIMEAAVLSVVSRRSR